MVVEIKNQSTSRGIQSLQVITTVGVVSTIIGFLSREAFPTLSLHGIAPFLLVIVATWLVNLLIVKIYQNLKYRLKFTNTSSEI